MKTDHIGTPVARHYWRKAIFHFAALCMSCGCFLGCSQSAKTYTQEVDEFKARVREELEKAMGSRLNI
jgi:hypothetical protein